MILSNFNSKNVQFFCPMLHWSLHSSVFSLPFHPCLLVLYACGTLSLSWNHIFLVPVWLLVQCTFGCSRKLDPALQQGPPQFWMERWTVLCGSLLLILVWLKSVFSTITCHWVSWSLTNHKNFLVFFYRPATQQFLHCPILEQLTGFAWEQYLYPSQVEFSIFFQFPLSFSQ